MTSTSITVQTLVNAPISKVWDTWTTPEEITKWNSPGSGWHTPKAKHDLVPGGKFVYRMESADGSQGFDFGGTFDEVKKNEKLSYTMGDGRKAVVTFSSEGNATRVVETFDAETENPVEMQRDGWQSILDSFKRYTEAQNS